ncbi:MAG: hypothetical protein LBU70_05350 [Chitinispirillales bacterium]|jgi:hypothetical protein|nr:hypothetical protein [Chitinispirillales bacterium]
MPKGIIVVDVMESGRHPDCPIIELPDGGLELVVGMAQHRINHLNFTMDLSRVSAGTIKEIRVAERTLDALKTIFERRVREL